MNIDDLLAKLEANAEQFAKPTAVEVTGIGTVYVRRRTVGEFEEMAAVNGAEPSGKFGPALARLLCDENGARLPAEYRDRLAALLARQPETVFHQLVEASDGTEKKAEAPGN